VEKEGAARMRIGKEEDGKKRKSEAKISFLRKFCPEVNSSLGGSYRLEAILDTTHRRMNNHSDILTKFGNTISWLGLWAGGGGWRRRGRRRQLEGE
jgi:hypothetical protein